MAEARRIVELGVGDVDLVVDLWKEMVDHHREVTGAPFPIRDLDEAWRRRRAQYLGWLEAAEGHLFLVPGDGAGRAPLGYAFLRIGGPPVTWDLGEKVGDLESLSVATAARGKGIGGQLIERCREQLREQGVEWWSLVVVGANERAIDLYEREGFRLLSHNMLARVE